MALSIPPEGTYATPDATAANPDTVVGVQAVQTVMKRRLAHAWELLQQVAA